MPASTPRLPSRPPPPDGPRRALRGDSHGVSEVIGYLLVFGILSMVLVLSMSAFSVGQEAAKERAIELRAESAAARVAGVIVQTAVLWEQQHGTGDLAVAYRIDLPEQLEGADYAVRLVETEGTAGGHVRVIVASFGIDVTAPLFSASAPSGLDICDGDADGSPREGYTEAPGGPLNVRINVPADGTPGYAPGCAANQLFLEEA